MPGIRIHILLEPLFTWLRNPYSHVSEYAQSRRLTVAEDKCQPDYDGMAELWFDDVEDLLAARRSPEWQASSEDEANFIDTDKVAYFVSEEHILCDEAKLKK